MPLNTNHQERLKNTNDLAHWLAHLQLEQLNQMLFNHHPDAIYVLTLNGDFYLVNDEACRLTGWPKEQLKGRNFIPLIHPDFIDITLDKFKQSTLGKPQYYETAIITEQGIIKHLDVTNFTIKIDEKAVGIFGIAKDISEKKQQEKELTETTAALKAQNEELEIFRKIIAHDMRRPVSNAIGFAKLLAESQLPDEVEREAKLLLLNTVESLDAMIRDLNEVISLKANGNEARENVSVVESVNRLVTLLSEEISKAGANVHILVPPTLSFVTIRVYFDSIIRNLLSNALKYRSLNRIPEITIKATISEDYLSITVKDNGIGMDMPNVSNDLFKMQKRFAPSVADGKGFGLYITHEQVKLLGGSISVESYPDHGSSFNVSLPIL